MNNLTAEEQQRFWQPDELPVRKILLWGLDCQKNPCLLILYGRQEAERKIKCSSPYYRAGYVLKPTVVYTKYAVFHGTNGHLPSIPNTCYCEKNNVLCYAKGYKTAHREWEYNRNTGWQERIDIDPKYIIKDFYEAKQTIAFDYYEKKNYTAYVASLKQNKVHFETVTTLIENPSDFFGFDADSPYMDSLVKMFSGERIYTRKKYLSQFIKMQPSVEEYERILKIASVELACGIFQELTIQKNPILLETAKQIDQSSLLWANEAYHSGLKRCIKQYLSLFDEKLLWKQKEFIYRTLPEMDFHIKQLTINGKTRKGKELEEYLDKPNAYEKILYDFDRQVVYEKNTYIDGKDLNNIAFKNTIQTAKAYGMADAIGKITYYLDAPRTTFYFKVSRRTSTYHYYLRYLRRTLDEYQATDEVKFITAAREMLTSYTDQDNLDSYYNDFSANFFFNKYFNDILIDDDTAEHSIWHNYLSDVIFIAKNAKATPVHEFCYTLLKIADAQHKFESYEIKELVGLSSIPYEKTAQLFEKKLLPRLEALQDFDAEIMISLMNTSSEKLWDVAEKYFIRTNGKFQPEHIADLLFLDTIETWYNILEDNINHFTTGEYITFLKTITEKRTLFLEQEIVLSEQITELLLNTVGRLDAATIEEQQDLLHYFIPLLLSLEKIPEFLFDIAENVIFCMPYSVLKDTLKDMELQHNRISEREYNTISLLKSCKEDTLPKDSLILSILETGSKRLVKTLTEIVDRQQAALVERTSTLLLLFECNVYHLNKTAQAVFENLEVEKREKMHRILLDSPIEAVYQYALKKLDDWYGNKIPTQFIARMLEHPCVEVKAYLSQKMKYAFSDLKETNPDLYIYYTKTLLYLSNKVSKSKERVYHTIPLFLNYYPEKRQEIEYILLDIGSSNSKIDSERALVTYAQIQKEVSTL